MMYHAVFRICDILVRIRMRILGSVPKSSVMQKNHFFRINVLII